MLHRAIPWLVALAVSACTPDSKSIGAGESSSAAGSGGGSEDNVASESSQSASMTSVGPGGEGTTSSASDSQVSIQSGTATAATLGSTTDGPSTTGEGDACDIFTVVAEAAAGKMEPDDCGYVRLDDPSAAWAAATQCALDHYQSGLAFTLVAEVQAIETAAHLGWAGAQGEVYTSSFFHSDSGPAVPGTHIEGKPCELVGSPGCVDEPGFLCLRCANESPDPMTVCESP